MNIELIYPTSWHTTDAPIGLGYIAAALKENGYGFNLNILTINQRSNELIAQWVNSREIDIACISVYDWNIKESKKIIELIKKKNEDTKIIIGGPVTQYIYQEALMIWQADFVVLGDGENTVAGIIESLSRDKSPLMEGVLSKDSNGEINGNTKILCEVDLSKIASPYMMDIFSAKEFKYSIPYGLTRGCPHSCIFCRWGSEDIPFRKKPINLVIRELKRLHEIGFKNILSIDGTFNFDKNYIIQLSNELRKNNLNFVWKDVDLRSDLLDEEMIKSLKDMGVIEVGFGLESSKKETQAIIKKNLDALELRDKVRLCKKFGMKVHVSLQLGLPMESKKDMLNTIEFARTIPADEFGVFLLCPEKGTESYTNIKKYNLSTCGNDLLNNGFVDKKEMENLREYAYSVLPAISSTKLEEFIIDGDYIPHKITKLSGDGYCIFLYLTDRCNNGCLPCRKNLSLKGVEDEFRVPDMDIRQVVLTGGEPTLIHPKKLMMITTSIRNRYPNAIIKMDTNCRIFKYKRNANLYVNGLGIKEYSTCALVDDEKNYEEITRVKDSFMQSRAGIKNLRLLKARVSIGKQ